MQLSKPLYVILAVGLLALSVASIFIKFAAAPGLVIAFYRMIFASLILLPLTISGLKETPLNGQNRGYALLAGICLGIHFATWISSLSFTTVAASVSVLTTQPIWVALFGWIFLGLAPSFMLLLGVLIAVAGGAMIGFGDFPGGSAPLLGDFLALLGAISGAAYLLLGRSAQKRGLGLNAYVGMAYGVAALVLLPLPWLSGLSYTQYPLKSFFWIALLALIPQLVGHSSINYLVRHLNPTLVATALLLEPILAGLLAFFLFKELPSLTTLSGGLVLLIGVAITLFSSSQLTKQANYPNS
jgi:drug/metabolite transporter (DMT)-like permease